MIGGAKRRRNWLFAVAVGITMPDAGGSRAAEPVATNEFEAPEDALRKAHLEKPDDAHEPLVPPLEPIDE